MSRTAFRWHAHTVGAVACLLSACATSGTLQPFSTDGCSMFPDRSVITSADWCGCCVAHDLAYWRGGTAEARRVADLELAACVKRVSGSEALADLMHAGVRAGGGSQLYTPFRWGYGWPYGRPDGPLTPDEDALASLLERQYRAKNPALACPVPAPTAD